MVSGGFQRIKLCSVVQPSAPSEPIQVFHCMDRLWRVGLIWRLGSICIGVVDPVHLVFGRGIGFVVESYIQMFPR